MTNEQDTPTQKLEKEKIEALRHLSIYTYINFIESLRLPAMVFHSSLELLEVNAHFQYTFNLSLDELVEKKVASFLGEELWTRLIDHSAEITRTPGVTAQLVDAEFEREGKFYRISMTPIKDGEGNTMGYLLFFLDTTREKMLEQARADFTSMIVHDLRSPLTAVMGNLELLFMEFEENCNEDTRELFNDSLEQAQRLLNLINDLLDVSKIESGKFSLHTEFIDPNEVIRYSIRSMEPLARREDIIIETALESTPIYLAADKDKLVQVMINLISNAIKFTPQKGMVSISSRKLVDPRSDKAYLTISVADTGEGIQKEHLPKLFEKFKQVDDKNKRKKIKGTGLGLFIVKELVEAHGGTLDVVSQLNRGTCFTLMFPLSNTH